MYASDRRQVTCLGTLTLLTVSRAGYFDNLLENDGRATLAMLLDNMYIYR